MGVRMRRAWLRTGMRATWRAPTRPATRACLPACLRAHTPLPAPLPTTARMRAACGAHTQLISAVSAAPSNRPQPGSPGRPTPLAAARNHCTPEGGSHLRSRTPVHARAACSSLAPRGQPQRGPSPPGAHAREGQRALGAVRCAGDAFAHFQAGSVEGLGPSKAYASECTTECTTPRPATAAAGHTAAGHTAAARGPWAAAARGRALPPHAPFKT